MNERLVATLLTVGILGTVYFAMFRVAGAKSGWRTRKGSRAEARDGERTTESTTDEPASGGGSTSDGAASDGSPPATRIGPRWDPGTTVALLAGAVGVLAQNTTTFLLGVVGFVYAAYRYGTRPPDSEVAVERAISDRSPRPSGDVEVTLAVRNEGDEALPDLRVVDGVPERLGVVSGSPRFCTSLRPGEEAEFSYEVRAHRGVHEFGPTALLVRNVSGSAERRWEQDADGRITCKTRAEDVPLPADTSSYPGHITTDAGGEGVEFYATREYQSADPMNRIDWKRYAKTGQLTTVEFRETRAATVMVVVDCRTPAHVSRRTGEPDAVELSEYAAERLAEAFVRRNDRVGLALFGPTERYLEPGGGDEQVARVRAELDHTPSPNRHRAGIFSEKRRERANETRFDTLRRQMPDSAQVVFLSPLTDDFAVDVAKRFRAYGHAVTVVSPDVTGEVRRVSDERGGTTRERTTPANRVEGIERARRLAEVRSGGVRVVDWSPDEPIRTAVSAATARWSG